MFRKVYSIIRPACEAGLSHLRCGRQPPPIFNPGTIVKSCAARFLLTNPVFSVYVLRVCGKIPNVNPGFFAFFLGALAAASLPLGAIVGLHTRFSARALSALLAFGAGALLFALSVEIVAHSYHEVGFVPLALGCIAGGLVFEAFNQILNNYGGFLRKTATLMRFVTLAKKKRAEELFDHLSRVPILHYLPANEMAKLVAHIEEIDFEQGSVVFEEGETGDSLYLVDAGEVEVTREGKHVTTLGAGECFGEMALISHEPRNTTVRARVKSHLYKIPKSDFDQLVQSSEKIRDDFEALIGRRSDELSERSLISPDMAANWKRAAMMALHDGDLSPTRLQAAVATKDHGHSVLGVWLGNLLDAIPEAMVLGIMATNPDQFSWVLLGGICLANFPEALSSSVAMHRHGYRKGKIISLWGFIVVASAVSSFGGYYLLGMASRETVVIVEGVAAGAMLTMIAETMLPEAYEQGGAVVGLSTLAGFLAALFLKSLH